MTTPPNYTMNGTKAQILFDNNVDVDAERDESMALYVAALCVRRDGRVVTYSQYLTRQLEAASSACIHFHVTVHFLDYEIESTLLGLCGSLL